MVLPTLYLAKGLADWPAMSGDPRLTRRAVLLGAAAFAIAACRPRRSGRTSSSPSTNAADHAALEEARASEMELIAAYDSAIPPDADPSSFLVAARAVHAEHLRALGGSQRGPTTSPSPPASPAVGSGRLPELETASSSRLRRAAIAAEGSQPAVLLASIAASHALLSHYRQVGGSG